MGAISAQCWAYSQEKEADNHHDQDQQEQIPLLSYFFAKPGGIAGWIEGKCEAAKKNTR